MIDRTAPEFRSYLELYERASLLELGHLADAERWRQHPENVVTYIIDRNINYTNVCVADCKFCAFYRRPKHREGYVLSFEQIGAKIDECKAIGGVQILLQGGHNPYIPFEWYLDLLRYIKRHHPIHIHGFSPSEVDFFAGRFGMTIVRLLQANRRRTVVLDHDAEQIEALRKFGYRVYYGDAARLDLLAADAASATGVPAAACREYLAGLDYAFTYKHLAGLTDFFRRLAAEGIVPDGSLQFLQVA